MAHTKRDRGLFLVALFKLGKAIFFGLLAAGALKLVHYDVGDLAQTVVDWTRIPQGPFISMLLDKADLIGGHQLRQGAILSSSYAVVCVVEGIGLWMEKTWAEYFTIALTTLALPWEAYELVRKFSGLKVGLMVLNVAVLLYLIWFVKLKRARAAGGV